MNLLVLNSIRSLFHVHGFLSFRPWCRKFPSSVKNAGGCGHTQVALFDIFTFLNYSNKHDHEIHRISFTTFQEFSAGKDPASGIYL